MTPPSPPATRPLVGPVHSMLATVAHGIIIIDKPWHSNWMTMLHYFAGLHYTFYVIRTLFVY